MMGSTFPRNGLAEGSPAGVKHSVREFLNALDDRSRLISSCEGGMQSHALAENIKALISTVAEETGWVAIEWGGGSGILGGFNTPRNTPVTWSFSALLRGPSVCFASE